MDSHLWMHGNINTGRPLSFIAWIHSHVAGMHCCFSSIDVHTQYSHQLLYPGSFGIVVQIRRDSSVGVCDAYIVNDDGSARVWDCNDRNRSRPLSRVQHQSCGIPALYTSI